MGIRDKLNRALGSGCSGLFALPGRNKGASGGAEEVDGFVTVILHIA